jgi:hypothetical protein
MRVMSHAVLLDLSGHCRTSLDVSGLSFYSLVALNAEKVTGPLDRTLLIQRRAILRSIEFSEGTNLLPGGPRVRELHGRATRWANL